MVMRFISTTIGSRQVNRSDTGGSPSRLQKVYRFLLTFYSLLGYISGQVRGSNCSNVN